MLRILIGDNQTYVRSALLRVLREQPGLEVIGEAARWEDLFALAEQQQPDLILLDWELSGLPPAQPRITCFPPRSAPPGFPQCTRRGLLASLHALPCHPRLIVLSCHPEVARAAQAAGADLFLSKGDPPEQFLRSLRAFDLPST